MSTPPSLSVPQRQYPIRTSVVESEYTGIKSYNVHAQYYNYKNWGPVQLQPTQFLHIALKIHEFYILVSLIPKRCLTLIRLTLRPRYGELIVNKLHVYMCTHFGVPKAAKML